MLITRILKDGARFGKVRTLRVEGEVEIGEVMNPEDEVGDTGIFEADTRDTCHLEFGLGLMLGLFSVFDDTRTCIEHRKHAVQRYLQRNLLHTLTFIEVLGHLRKSKACIDLSKFWSPAFYDLLILYCPCCLITLYVIAMPMMLLYT